MDFAPRKHRLDGKTIDDERKEERRKREETIIFQSCHTMAEAVKYSQMYGNLPIFPYDKPVPKDSNATGKKKFFVGSYQSIWSFYNQMKKEQRAMYETIMSDIPCHIHIDAEYIKEFNSESDPEWLNITLKKELIDFTVKTFPELKHEDIQLVTLDASSAKKFSKHYMLYIKGHMLKNNYHCGALIRRFRLYIIDKYGADLEKNPFFIIAQKKDRKEKGKTYKSRDFLVDLAIYTLRRAWRVYGSTKRDTYRPLFFEGEDKETAAVTQEKFFGTLSQRPRDEDFHLLECLEHDGTEPRSTNDTKLYKPNINLSETSNLAMPNVGLRADSFKNRNKDKTFRPSDPIPPIATSIANAIQRLHTGAGSLTPSYYNAEYKSIRYDSNSHVCSVKGSAHGGNHIWFKAFLRRGTFIQGCYSDKEPCLRSTRERVTTEEIALPANVIAEIDKMLSKDDNAKSEGDKWSTILPMFVAQFFPRDL